MSLYTFAAACVSFFAIVGFAVCLIGAVYVVSILADAALTKWMDWNGFRRPFLQWYSQHLREQKGRRP